MPADDNIWIEDNIWMRIYLDRTPAYLNISSPDKFSGKTKCFWFCTRPRLPQSTTLSAKGIFRGVWGKSRVLAEIAE
jgi:hypothetical protein